MIKTICHLTSVHHWADTRIFNKECVSLSKNGNRVYLIALGCETKNVSGVNLVAASPKFNSRLKRMSLGVYAVYKKALEINADVFHFHDPELLFVGWLLKRKGKKVIYDVHEDVPRQILSKPWIWKPLQTLVSSITEKTENFIASKLSAVVAATPTIGKRFLKINKNTFVINNFPLIQELESTTEWEKKNNAICYIGFITEIRGIRPLIQSLEFCAGIKLHLAGNYSSDKLKNELSLIPAWNKVKEYGFVNRKVAAEILHKSKVGIVTFLAVPNHVDAQPNKMFEYMSAGIPVIASHFPLWKEIIEGNQCGVCVDPENSQAIADAINYLINHDQEAKQMGLNGRKAVEGKFNWEIEEKKLIELYKNI